MSEFSQLGSRLNTILSDVINRLNQKADAGAYASASHTHAASAITSGTFSTGRIPNLAASKITSGTFANARISQSSVTQHQGSLTIDWGQLTNIPSLGGVDAYEGGTKVGLVESITLNGPDATIKFENGTQFNIPVI